MKVIEKISARTAGLCGILGPLIAFGAIATSIHLHPWFSWADNALSDLGATGTSYNMVFNLGLIAAGIAGLVFMLGLPRLVSRRAGLAGVIILGAGMISLILIGVFPSGTSPHGPVSVSFYALSLVGLVVLGVDQLRERSERAWGAFILSIVGLALAAIGFCNTIPYELGAAIPEIIGAIAILEFSVVFGARLLGLKSR
ncbi:MAG: DUF998 domain-containing protein [Candidatus Hadarchaeota archaeon]|nr:DUF998 domain-containing protein [Candidatus Hadarchaeota archaeon]